jgi:hypothetical protein
MTTKHHALEGEVVCAARADEFRSALLAMMLAAVAACVLYRPASLRDVHRKRVPCYESNRRVTTGEAHVPSAAPREATAPTA